jgi:hypothetical protein
MKTLAEMYSHPDRFPGTHSNRMRYDRNYREQNEQEKNKERALTPGPIVRGGAGGNQVEGARK